MCQLLYLRNVIKSFDSIEEYEMSIRNCSCGAKKSNDFDLLPIIVLI